MAEISEQITMPKSTFWRKWSFAGPGALVAVGYIDPGNWATDIAGGSYAGYTLLSIVLLSSIIAMLLQIMSARLGIATGKDLARLSRETWPNAAFPAWVAAELTIIATDLAEVLGSAIALKLLFGIPILIGVMLTVFDVLLILAFDKRGSRMLERLVVTFLFIIGCGLLYELILAAPVMKEVIRGFVPDAKIVLDPVLLYLAIGVIGATIMPHNLYLHSNLVIKRWAGSNKEDRAKMARIDTIISLSIAMLMNSALVILAASVFHFAGRLNVAEISDAYHLLAPLLGTSAAAIVFAVMLLAAGQSATITGTLAGQVVMDGFLNLRMSLWKRRLLTRMMALVPAVIVILYYGEQGITKLILGSQVFLSLQLPIAMISLLLLASNAKRMGTLVNSGFMHYLGWICALLIMLANFLLIVNII
jgi:manganese transport protein